MSYTDLTIIFNHAAALNYDHKEGGRYAYVQLMADLREIRLLLEPEKKFPKELAVLTALSDMLNELVAERFNSGHRVVFENVLQQLKNLEAQILYPKPAVKNVQIKGLSALQFPVFI